MDQPLPPSNKPTPQSVDFEHARGTGFWMIGLTGVVLLSLVIALRSIPDTQKSVIDILNRISITWIILSTLSMSFAFVCMAARWRSMMPSPHHPPLGELTGLICAGLLLNYAAPGPVGEVGAAWFAHKRYKLRLEDSLASGVSARLIGLMTTSILGFGIWLLFPLPITSELESLITLAAILIGIGGATIALIAAFPDWWEPRLLSLIKWFPIKKWSQKLQSAVQKVTAALVRVLKHHPSRYGWAVFWSLGAHTSVTIGIIFAALALGCDYNLAGLAFTYTITTASAVLLFAFPGSYLGWDALFFGLLVSTAGIPTADAAAIALIVRLQQIMYMSLGGISLSWLAKKTQ